MSQASDLLSADGLISHVLAGFRPRKEQQQLAETIEKIINSNATLVAEAGTGIGKTFAYLVPAIISQRKVIISTGTRHLQDQLFHNDIPLVKKALKTDFPSALLKGRSNYLCRYRLATAGEQAYISRDTHHQIAQIREWSTHTQSGDIAEMSEIPEDASVWPLVTSTTDNCLGTECPEWNDCCIVNARRSAQDADIVVVNHHLLLADMALKEEGFGELLPSADTFIIDEAHQLPEIATRFFGKGYSSRQLNNLINDTTTEYLRDAPDMPELRECCEQLKTDIAQFRLAFGTDQLRDSWNKIRHKPALQRAKHQLLESLHDLQDQLEIAAERSKGLEQCYQRCQLLLQGIQHYGDEDSEQNINWYETFTRGFVLHQTPLDIANIFRQQRQQLPGSWIFTSATLQVGKDFSHFADRLGLDEYHDGQWKSPFDYAQQSLLYLPKNLPEPSAADYTRKLVEAALPVLKASQGRAFLLFTSYRALNEAIRILQPKLTYPVLIQGTLPKHQLLEKFRELGNAVLLGTGSFWEGVDVRGEALSCVIIDKLPFASPGDPVMQARLDSIRHQGGNPFMDYQLPQAVITLKQGAGRLIRDTKDYGVLMIGDNRLESKRYGRVFIESLPDMPRTDRINDVEAFYQSWHNTGDHTQ